LAKLGIVAPIAKRKIRDFSPDVIFFPTARLFQLDGIPIVTTVQNMEPLAPMYGKYPLLEKLRLKILAKSARCAVKRANGVIAISGFVKNHLCEELSLARDKVKLIYYGGDTPGLNDAVRPNQKNLDLFERGFLFSAGPVRPYKGFEDIICAMQYLSKYDFDYPPVVIAGHVSRSFKRYKEKLDKLSKKKGVYDKVFWAGRLNPQEMNWCFQNCAAFIMTSRVESASNLALEAMSHGCVIISTANQALPEMFGNTAQYYETGSGENLAHIVRQTLDWTDDKRKNVAEEAKKRSSMFSWDIMAEKTLSVLEKAVEKERL